MSLRSNNSSKTTQAGETEREQSVGGHPGRAPPPPAHQQKRASKAGNSKNYHRAAFPRLGLDHIGVVGVRPERLDDQRSGRVDLRTLLLEAPEGEWYIATPEGMVDDPLTLEPQQAPLSETDYLPESGHFLDDEPPDVVASIWRALEREKVVVVVGQVGADEPRRRRMGGCSPTTE